MIQTSKDAAIVVRAPTSQRIQEWLKTREEFIIRIGDGDPAVDLAIVRGEKKKANAIEVEAIRPKQYNKQQSWFVAGKRLRDWSGNLFHLDNPLIAALWICGKAEIEKVLFADVRPERILEEDYRRNQFRDVARQLREEFRIGVVYNDRRSQLFKEIGGELFEIETESTKAENIDLPSAGSVFENNFETGWINSVSTPLVRYEDGVVGAVVDLGGRTLTSTSAIPADRSRVEGDGIFVLDPDQLGKAVKLYGNFKEIYLINEEVRQKIDQVKKQNLATEKESPLLETFLAFAIGGNFDEVQTQGIVERVGERQKEIINRV